MLQAYRRQRQQLQCCQTNVVPCLTAVAAYTKQLGSVWFIVVC